MRKLDWFLAAVVVAFLAVGAVIETSRSFGAGRWDAVHGGGPAEVSMRPLVSHLPHPPIVGE